MLDINYIRENIEIVKKAVKDKSLDVDIEKLLEVDKKRRGLILKVDDLRSKRNIAAKEKNIEEGKKIKEELDTLEEELRGEEERFKHLMLYVPNIPDKDVPIGDPSKFEVLRKEGEPRKFNFTPSDHLEIGEKLDIIDISTAAKVSGSRFAYLKNQGVILEISLVCYALDVLAEAGFTPVIPPVLIKKELTEGLGYWHGMIDEHHTANENYYLVNDYEEVVSGNHKSNPLYLIGTGEHAIVPMHAGETLDGEELPKKYAAYSPCFRREAGSYGKDTRGILRVHQFDKVEMVEFVRPEDDETERRKMLGIAEDFMKSLGLPYQVVKLASGDLSFPAAETIDIETWIPSQNRYRETHSISTTTDFQSRRLNIKFKQKQLGSMTLMGVGGGLRVEYVHILNGTAFAIGRTIIAILENFQREDGSVKIPEVLQKYTNFSEIRPK